MADARAVLTLACREAGVPALWTEWCSDDPRIPEYARNLGSPTVLVNGEDVAPGPHAWVSRETHAGPRCRIYRDDDTLLSAPPLSRVTQAIGAALGPSVG